MQKLNIEQRQFYGLSCELPNSPKDRIESIRNIWSEVKSILSKQGIDSYSQSAIIENDLPNSTGTARYLALCDYECNELEEYKLEAGEFLCIEHQGLPKDLGKTLQKIGPDQFKSVTKSLELFLYPENYKPNDPAAIIKYLLPIS